MNAPTPHWLGRIATPLAALCAIAVCFALAQFPALPEKDRQQLAARFKFDKLPLPEVVDHPPYKLVREVHPSLKRIAAWISSLGAAAALADLDGDGLPNDLIHVDPRTDLVTVAPGPGSGQRYAPFVLSPAPLRYNARNTAPMGVLVGDFNEDGFSDILVYFWGRTPVVYMRRTAGAKPGQTVVLSRDLYEPTELTGSGERWYTNAATQADLDGDGHLDLVIGNYFQDGAHILDAEADGIEVMHEGKAKALNGGKKHIFLWAGVSPKANFREVHGVLDDEVLHGWTLAAGTVDIDADQMPDLYLGNDFGPDRLLHNNSKPGHLAFTLLEGDRRAVDPKSCVLGHDSFKGMGVDFADINGDGLPDIYVSNIATKFGLTESHFLWQSTGALDQMKKGVAPYINMSEELGLSRSGWGWDCRLVDFDNDGVLEAIQAVGFIRGTVNRWPELQSLGTSNDRVVHDPRFWPNFKPGADLSGNDLNPFFVRSSNGRFFNVGSEVGFNEPMVTKAIAVADVDGDGRMDFVFGNQWMESYYFHNVSPNPGAFLGLHLLLPLADERGGALRERAGHPGPDLRGRPAIGASARFVLTDGSTHAAQVDGGSGHSGRRSPDLHFGLGATRLDQKLDVALKWRDTSGSPRTAQLKLTPGWHTVLLGESTTPKQTALRSD